MFAKLKSVCMCTRRHSVRDGPQCLHFVRHSTCASQFVLFQITYENKRLCTHITGERFLPVSVSVCVCVCLSVGWDFVRICNYIVCMRIGDKVRVSLCHFSLRIVYYIRACMYKVFSNILVNTMIFLLSKWRWRREFPCKGQIFIYIHQEK